MLSPGQERVVVGVNGSIANLAALRVAVAHARVSDALLVPVLAWVPVDGQVGGGRNVPGPSRAVLRVCEEAAHDRLNNAFEEAFGGHPAFVRVDPVVSCAAPEDALLRVANRESDLLVLGSATRGRISLLLQPSVTRYCVAQARCPALVVPPPEMLGVLRARPRWLRRGHELERIDQSAARRSPNEAT
ncbi:MAG: hypothetical protein JWN95_2960 [Frankiales bacterium]|nr:hypothetical protein [Frankiales bacterium]